MNDNVGINRDKLKNLILKTYEYRDKINKILNEIQNSIESTKQYYISSDGDYLREHFNKFYDSKNIIIQNMKSYCSDLEKVLQNFEKIQNKNVEIFNNYVNSTKTFQEK